MKNALLICDLIFAFCFGIGVACSTNEASPLLFFLAPLLFLTGFIVIESY